MLSVSDGALRSVRAVTMMPVRTADRTLTIAKRVRIREDRAGDRLSLSLRGKLEDDDASEGLCGFVRAGNGAKLAPDLNRRRDDVFCPAAVSNGCGPRMIQCVVLVRVVGFHDLRPSSYSVRPAPQRRCFPPRVHAVLAIARAHASQCRQFVRFPAVAVADVEGEGEAARLLRLLC